MILSPHIYDSLFSHHRSYPGNILEIGAFNGAGTKKLAERLVNKQIISIDPFIEDGHTRAASGADNNAYMTDQYLNYTLATEGLKNCHLYKETSQEFAKKHTDQALKDLEISVVIIDGSHHYQDVDTDWRLAIRCLGDRPGLILFDDIEISGVNRACEEFKKINQDRILEEHDIFGVAKKFDMKGLA